METISELKERAALLERIVELGKQIADLDLPSEEEIEAVANHIATLKAIEEIDPPSDEEIEAVANHYATLKAIEEAA
jgi:cytochrome c553